VFGNSLSNLQNPFSFLQKTQFLGEKNAFVTNKTKIFAIFAL
jgi:hypothetical protein